MVKKAGKRKTSKATLAGHKELYDTVMAGDLPPPAYAYLPPEAVPIYKDLVRARARSTWSQSDLGLACDLAVTRLHIAEMSEELKTKGHILQNKKGTPVANPTHSILETLTRRNIALTRVLGINLTAGMRKTEADEILAEERALAAKVSEAKAAEKKEKKSKKKKEEDDGYEDDDDTLIPFPQQIH